MYLGCFITILFLKIILNTWSKNVLPNKNFILFKNALFVKIASIEIAILVY